MENNKNKKTALIIGVILMAGSSYQPFLYNQF